MTDERKGSGGIHGESASCVAGVMAGVDSGLHPVAGALVERLEQVIAQSPVEQLPVLLAALSALAGRLAVRLLTVPERRQDAGVADENLSVEEAARRLGVSTEYLYRHAKRLPFTRRVGRRLLFSARGLERWNRRPS